MLNDTGLVRSIFLSEGGNQSLQKPEKIFLNNTTLLTAINRSLGQTVDQGTIREIFFIQSLENAGTLIFYSKEGDYRTDKFVFEVGGKNKTRKQIKHLGENAFLVKDDISLSKNNEIPLYYFGFLY